MVSFFWIVGEICLNIIITEFCEMLFFYSSSRKVLFNDVIWIEKMRIQGLFKFYVLCFKLKDHVNIFILIQRVNNFKEIGWFWVFLYNISKCVEYNIEFIDRELKKH